MLISIVEVEAMFNISFHFLFILFYILLEFTLYDELFNVILQGVAPIGIVTVAIVVPTIFLLIGPSFLKKRIQRLYPRKLGIGTFS